ncbi:hypothetical protein [Mycobacterium sp. SMC-4]|uniref:hypothetical protein n=1 Tax=Mycobacterium sp. SMC-4 TaxID=2857059 RepID=UPI0021B4B084|nr:hypothetical protein [Mycobacterium sp. SMC-4]UXA19534.1 hypothetical protein KXD98_08020 [Mycobacterium sp. SMC-4]
MYSAATGFMSRNTLRHNTLRRSVAGLVVEKNGGEIFLTVTGGQGVVAQKNGPDLRLCFGGVEELEGRRDDDWWGGWSASPSARCGAVAFTMLGVAWQ